MNDGPRVQASRQRHLLVFLLFLHTVNTYMDRVCISAAKGDIQADVAGLSSDRAMGYVFGIFAVGYALFQIPAGWLSDRLGPRRALTAVVIVWSAFTALTGAVYTAAAMLVVRFLFGVGEAGAYPGATRAMYSWLPARERGLGQGVFHSGARVGAALSLVLMPWVIGQIGWRWTFAANAALGLAWAAVWWAWFRDRPRDHHGANEAEVSHIEQGLEAERDAAGPRAPFVRLVTSANVLLAMLQYAASNFTFFISITWFQPYLRERYGDGAVAWSAVPLLAGAVALWLSGGLVTYLHRRGHPVASRRLPAMAGFALGAAGLLLCAFAGEGASVYRLVAGFSLAIFGVEMTLSPSWSFCMDIGGERSGAVSGSMNMVGNLGAAVSAVLFPVFVASVTLPVVAPVAGTPGSFFAFAAGFNLVALAAWLFMDPTRRLDAATSPGSLRVRLGLLLGLVAAVLAALIYVNFVMEK